MGKVITITSLLLVKKEAKSCCFFVVTHTHHRHSRRYFALFQNTNYSCVSSYNFNIFNKPEDLLENVRNDDVYNFLAIQEIVIHSYLENKTSKSFSNRYG